MNFIFYLLLSLGALINASAERLPDFSFQPPYEELDHAGERLISRQWRTAGSTSVSSTFVRLTPDRQSKKGAIWSRQSLGLRSVSLAMKFRISGQGKQFFGDGLALWLVTQGYYVEGETHGFTEKFVGVGIVFDTFKNTETLHTHRDVTVLVNDGEQTWASMTQLVQGCNINVRYHAERADFNAKDSVSMAKLVLTEYSLDLFVDARNTGEFTRCVRLEKLNLPRGWLEHAHVGITASTGQLADNHDVVSLHTYSETLVMEEEQAAMYNKKWFPTLPESTVEERLLRLENEVNAIMNKFEFLDHHNEHEMVAIEDQLDNLEMKIKRVDARGANEGEPNSKVVSDIVKVETESLRVDSRSFAQRLEGFERRLQQMAQQKPVVTPVSSGDWKLPFALLAVLVVGAVLGMYLFYLHLARKWKLP